MRAQQYLALRTLGFLSLENLDRISVAPVIKAPFDRELERSTLMQTINKYVWCQCHLESWYEFEPFKSL